MVQYNKDPKTYKEQVAKGEILEYHKDPGNEGFAKGWAAVDCDLPLVLGLQKVVKRLGHGDVVGLEVADVVVEAHVPVVHGGEGARAVHRIFLCVRGSGGRRGVVGHEQELGATG